MAGSVMCFRSTQETRVYNVENDVAGILHVLPIQLKKQGSAMWRMSWQATSTCFQFTSRNEGLQRGG